MRRTWLIAVAVLAAAGGVAWYFLSGQTWTLTFTQAQIEERLAKRFPVHKNYLLVVGVHYENPRVRLTDGSDRIGIGVDARVDVTVSGRELTGSADLDTRLAYDAENATIVLADARVVDLHVSELSDELAKHVRDGANQLAATAITGIPIYKLQFTNPKAALARLVLKSVSVRDGVLHVEIGL